MPRHPGPQPYGSRFAPLVAHLATRDEETVTLTLAQIEAIIGGSLSVTATVSPAWWVGAPQRHVRDLRAAGWRAYLTVPERAVTFRRIDPAPEEG